jgi:hypothetical protein
VSARPQFRFKISNSQLTWSSPLSRRSRIPETVVSISDVSGILDAPLKAGHDSGEIHESLAAARRRPSCASRITLEIEEGAGKAGCWLHPWPACSKKSTRRSPQVQPETSGLPCAMVLTVSFALPGDRASCPRHEQIVRSLGISVGMPGPHDFAVRDDITRPRHRALISPRPSHPISRSVTIGHNAPLAEAGWRDRTICFRKTEAEINLASRCEYWFFLRARFFEREAIGVRARVRKCAGGGESVDLA